MNDDLAPAAIRDANAADHAAILALNLESEALVSPMDAERLRQLDAQSAYHRVVEIDGQVAAFLLAFREGADYDSPNYRWFAERYPRFVYIDRIIVSVRHQGRQLGRALYEDLFAFARENGIDTVTCEFYTVPLNEGSSRFHAKLGFHEVGQQWVADGKKQVSLQTATP
ncbi:GNAT family N-acetyltransferase [Luteimonas sp. SX5]|uniref:GNAT family N-acetyltransferase n=1 Tax=Luteimonas galliterrae TaxID=2940486 RepID=A0ABT0MJQ0_9GAMM|nr:GNAT family N-acetyltransferase [Luteimonas galliterrae]MCL1635091.1 GNAT family N-acetyltransferase [Luteimonas galliterrae]